MIVAPHVRAIGATAFLAKAVEMVEARTIVLAVGVLTLVVAIAGAAFNLAIAAATTGALRRASAP